MLLDQAKRTVTFGEFTFKVAPYNTADNAEAMVLAASFFPGESGTKEQQRELLEIMIDRSGKPSTSLNEKLLDARKLAVAIGVDMDTDPGRLRYMHNHWEDAKLAMCCELDGTELRDIYDVIIGNPEFRKAVQDAAFHIDAPKVEEEKAKNA